MFLEELTDQILGAAIEVHRMLGPGLLEATYEACLAHELTLRGLSVERQKAYPVMYKGARLDRGYRADVVVDGMVIVEVKAVSRVEPVHTAQLLSYLMLSGVRVGLLINFNVTRLNLGIRRVVNQAPDSPPRPPRAPR